MRALLFSHLNPECLILDQFAFCLAVFMLGSRNLRPASGVSSYKYPNSYNKVVNSVIAKSKKCISITWAPFHNFATLSIKVLAQFNE